MTPEQFCYWLAGYCELTTEPPTPEQWKAIKEHVESVFQKVTPRSPGTVTTTPASMPTWVPGYDLQPTIRC